MGTSAIVIPRTYRAYKWTTGQVRPFPQPPGLWLAEGHFLAPLEPMRAPFPRPDSETESYAHHHWAYYDGTTGIQYRKRVTPSFGSPPYVFEVLDGPEGAMIQAPSWKTEWFSGTQAAADGYALFVWTPTATVTGQRVWVRAYDMNGAWVDFIWTLSTSSSTAQFIFVDNVNGVDTNTGTIAAPYKTVVGAYGTSDTTATNPGAICYLRGSATMYELPVYTGNSFTPNAAYNPSALIGYPGESVTIDASSASTGLTAPDMAIQDLCYNGYMSTASNYVLLRVSAPRWYLDNVMWTNAGYGSIGNSVAGMVVSGDTGGANIQYGVMCGCAEFNRVSGNPGNNYSGCAFYSFTDVVVWLNSSFSPNSNADNVWYFKSNISYGFMWGNYANILSTYGYGIGQAPDEPPGACGPNDFQYNAGIGIGHINLPNTGNSAYSFGLNRVGRNSMVGGGIAGNQPNGPGTFQIDSNALQTSSSLPTGTAITTDGLNIVAASGVLNPDGTLDTANYPNALGVVGAQIQ